jgi:hypothetical protein
VTKHAMWPHHTLPLCFLLPARWHLQNCYTCIRVRSAAVHLLVMKARLSILLDMSAALQAAEAAWEADALERAAALARAALPAALPVLKYALVSPLASGAAPTPEALECLCWLLRLAASVLADAGQSETPMVPVEVLELCEDNGAAVADAAELGSMICQVLHLGAAVLELFARTADEMVHKVMQLRACRSRCLTLTCVVLPLSYCLLFVVFSFHCDCRLRRGHPMRSAARTRAPACSRLRSPRLRGGSTPTSHPRRPCRTRALR